MAVNTRCPNKDNCYRRAVTAVAGVAAGVGAKTDGLGRDDDDDAGETRLYRRSSHFEKENYSSVLDGVVAAANAVGGDSDVTRNKLSRMSSKEHVAGSVKLLTLPEVPDHLAFNRNIRSGYRSALTLQQCVARYKLIHSWVPKYIYLYSRLRRVAI